MNNNKQQTKGNKMRKIAMVIGVLTVMATSANADTGHIHQLLMVVTQVLHTTYNYLLGGWN